MALATRGDVGFLYNWVSRTTGLELELGLGLEQCAWVVLIRFIVWIMVSFRVIYLEQSLGLGVVLGLGL